MAVYPAECSQSATVYSCVADAYHSKRVTLCQLTTSLSPFPPLFSPPKAYSIKFILQIIYRQQSTTKRAKKYRGVGWAPYGPTMKSRINRHHPWAQKSRSSSERSLFKDNKSLENISTLSSVFLYNLLFSSCFIISVIQNVNWSKKVASRLSS